MSVKVFRTRRQIDRLRLRWMHALYGIIPEEVSPMGFNNWLN